MRDMQLPIAPIIAALGLLKHFIAWANQLLNR